MCKKYCHSLDHLFHSLIILLVWGCCISYDKYLSKIDKFQKRSVHFGFLKEAKPIFSSLEASDDKLWKNVTNSAERPLVDLLPPCKTKLLRKELWSLLCTSVFIKLGLNVLNTVLLIGVLLIYLL